MKESLMEEILMKEPLKFEAYLSLDVPDPLCKEIYAIRDAFSDKKMSVMPVDIPLIGHADAGMTLIREQEEVKTCIDAALKKNGHNPPHSFEIETGQYSMTNRGQLILHLIHTEAITALRQRILNQFLSSSSSPLRALAERALDQEYEPLIYTVLKSHMPKTAFEDILRTSPGKTFKTVSLSLYHKEAVPLTRIQSWEI